MTEAPPVAGLPLHTRSLTVSLKACADGRWLARGDIIDLRKNGFVPTSYDIQPSGIIHSMNIELDLDPSTLRIDAVRVDQPFIAVEASPVTRGECCRDPAPILLDFAGETLDETFPRKLAAKFGGPLGCSHLLTLFQLMASTIPHATACERRRLERDATEQDEGQRFFRRSVFLDGLQASRDSTDISLQLADTHTRPFSNEEHALDRLERSHEVKTFASVGRKRFDLTRLEIRERLRSAETMRTARWIDHSDHFASLVGTPMIPGLAGRIFALVGDDPALGAVKDNLLMFAPGFIQVTAAQMEMHYEEQAKAGSEGKVDPPAVTSLGGNPGACYMWRQDGPISKARTNRVD